MMEWGGVFLTTIEWIFKIISSCGIHLGALGVGLFFLLSGFSISISLDKNVDFSFFIKRFFRIYPVWIIGFSIVCGVIAIYTNYIGSPLPYTFDSFLWEVLLVRDWKWSPYVDFVVWTLEAELKFYILGYVIYRFDWQKKRKKILSIGTLLCVFNVLSFVLQDIIVEYSLEIYKVVSIIAVAVPSLLYMLIGVCIYNWFKGYWSREESLKMIILIYSLFCVSYYLSPVRTETMMRFLNYMLALATFISIYILRGQLRFQKFFFFFADISYPLYVIHGVCGYILIAVLNSYGIPPYIVLFLAILTVILISWLIHIMVEKSMKRLCALVVKRCCRTKS